MSGRFLAVEIVTRIHIQTPGNNLNEKDNLDKLVLYMKAYGLGMLSFGDLFFRISGVVRIR